MEDSNQSATLPIPETGSNTQVPSLFLDLTTLCSANSDVNIVSQNKLIKLKINDENFEYNFVPLENGRVQLKTRNDDTTGLNGLLNICVQVIQQVQCYGMAEKDTFVLQLDADKAKTTTGRYEEFYDYFDLGTVLGKGYNGDIVVVLDQETMNENAMKTVLIAEFKTNEILCWCDMSDSGICPRLYTFTTGHGKIYMHMEPFLSSVTLTDIIDQRLQLIRKRLPFLIRPFSLYVFRGLLDAVNKMKGYFWTHNDLKCDNVLFTTKLDMKILDFGQAKCLSEVDFPKHDTCDIVRMFTNLYLDDEMADSKPDDFIGTVRANDLFNTLSNAHRREVICLIEFALESCKSATNEVTRGEELVKSLNEIIENEHIPNLLHLYKKDFLTGVSDEKDMHPHPSQIQESLSNQLRVTAKSSIREDVDSLNFMHKTDFLPDVSGSDTYTHSRPSMERTLSDESTISRQFSIREDLNNSDTLRRKLRFTISIGSPSAVTKEDLFSTMDEKHASC